MAASVPLGEWRAMRNAVILVTLALVGVVVWAGLLLLMNSVPPTDLTRGLFLVLWFLGLLCHGAPLAYLANARFAAPLGRRGDLQRALRQGALGALAGAALMGLQFLGVLTPVIALAVVLGAVVLEAMVRLRTR